jgi:hypothetical protein
MPTAWNGNYFLVVVLFTKGLTTGGARVLITPSFKISFSACSFNFGHLYKIITPILNNNA